MPASCQPPTTAPSTPPSFNHRRSGPKGSSIDVADHRSLARVEPRRPVPGANVRDRLSVAHGAAAARGRPAVVQRLAVGVADKELQTVGEPLLHLQRARVGSRLVARVALQHVVDRRDRLQEPSRRLRSRSWLDLVRVVAEDQMLACAADVGQLHQHRGEQLALDPEMPLLRVRRLVLETMALHAGIRRNQLRGRLRLDRHNRWKRIGNRSQCRRCRAGSSRGVDILRDGERDG